jgi:hypothetical protein
MTTGASDPNSNTKTRFLIEKDRLEMPLTPSPSIQIAFLIEKKGDFRATAVRSLIATGRNYKAPYLAENKRHRSRLIATGGGAGRALGTKGNAMLPSCIESTWGNSGS